MFTRTLYATLLVALTVSVAFAQKDKPKSKQPAKKKRRVNPAMARVTDDPKLPRVLLIGDSISIGYTVPVRERMKGKANVHRPQLRPDNQRRRRNRQVDW